MIYIDVSPAVHSRAGLGRYAEKLAFEIAKQREVTLFHNEGQGAKMPATLSDLPAIKVQFGYKPWRMFVFVAQLLQSNLLSYDKKLSPNSIFHATEHLLIPLTNVPSVITIHDIIPHLFPKYHKKLNYWFLKYAMPLFCKRATAIVTVSNSTKNDIVKYYKIPAEKIHVIPEAAAEHFHQPSPSKIAEVKEKYELPADYLLHIGTIEPRKNLDRLVDVLLELRNSGHPNLTLVLAGAKGWLYEDFFARLEAENLKSIVISPGWIDDGDLPGLIAGARLGVQPSLYEGFGLPILEHMACGQVVASSNRSSLPEVGGDAAVYFDPEDVSDMVNVIDSILTDPKTYEARQKLSLEQAKRFSWEKTATATIELYDKIRETYATKA